MGMKELLIILAVAMVVFGAKKLRSVGEDLGHAVRGFKKAMDQGEQNDGAAAGPRRQLRSDGPDAAHSETARPAESQATPADAHSR